MQNKKRIKKIRCENDNTIQFVLDFIVDTLEIEVLLTDTVINLERSVVYSRRILKLDHEKEKIQESLAEILLEMYEEYEEKKNIYTVLKEGLKNYNVFEVSDEE